MVEKRTDVTDECVLAVYQRFVNHCKKEESGMYQIKYGNML